jgi:hypothetical protein
MNRPRWLITLALLVVPLVASTAQATPTLQLYLEGATYDTVTHTWVAAPEGSSNGQPFRLWAIGDVGATPEHLIEGVRLSVAYDKSWRTDDYDLVVSFVPSTTAGRGNYDDPSEPTAPVFLQYGGVNTVPMLGDGKPLPTHGVFGPDTVWQEFALGDFNLMDSPVGDFIGTFPSQDEDAPLRGQINVYEVTVTWTGGASAHGAVVHFDLYNHFEAKNHIKARFAPFSHDADAEGKIVPAPSTPIALIGMGLMGAIVYARRRFWA